MWRNNRDEGFTLLELVMVIILISILGLFVMDRVWSLRVAAERAAVAQVTGNIRSALGLEVARYALENRLDELARLDGSNPVRLLAQAPADYRGETTGEEADAGWFYDPASKTLGYRARYPENAGENGAPLRWQIRLIYQDRDGNRRFDATRDAIEGLDLVRLPPAGEKKLKPQQKSADNSDS